MKEENKEKLSECKCVCHKDPLKKGNDGYLHDTECCENMNGIIKSPSPNPKEELSDCCGAKIITGARTFDNFNGTVCSRCGRACLDKIPEINPSPTPQEGWEIGIMSLKPLHDLERIGAVKEIEQIKDFVRSSRQIRREKIRIRIEKARKQTLDEAIKVVEGIEEGWYHEGEGQEYEKSAVNIKDEIIKALNSLRDIKE